MSEKSSTFAAAKSIILTIMKNNILFSAVLFISCLASIPVNAQLEVRSTGDALISKHMAVDTDIDTTININVSHTSTNALPYHGIKSHVLTNAEMPTSSIYGVCGFADASHTHSDLSNSPIVGVFGKAAKPYEIISNFSAGIAGMANYYGGIGVYGGLGTAVDLFTPNAWKGAAFAGYFDGTVKVNGTLYATAVSTTSDLRQKENIQNITPSLAQAIQALQPVSYTLKQDSAWKYDKEATELQGVHYGLIAQDVQEILPEIVYQRGEQLSINYIELIPLLIKTVQELSARVKELETISTAKSPIKQKATNTESIDAVLYQNNPNPFTIDTQIAYKLPLTANSATLYVYDMNGTQVAEYPILSLGEGSVTISAGTLNAGMYLYTLIADGQVIDTKRMILTK